MAISIMSGVAGYPSPAWRGGHLKCIKYFPFRAVADHFHGFYFDGLPVHLHRDVMVAVILAAVILVAVGVGGMTGQVDLLSDNPSVNKWFAAMRVFLQCKGRTVHVRKM